MRKAIRDHVKDFVAILALLSVGITAGIYIVKHERLRLPLIDETPFELKAEFSTAQALTPGQGQTIRISGIRIGDIAEAELHDGRAIVTLEIDQRYSDLVHTDATALLRPKTGLKDMFVELDPGTKGAPLVKEGFTLPIGNTLPDVNPDEILSALDSDTRDYLKLLLKGAHEGLEGRSDDLREALKRFEPTYRDLALVTGEVRKRHAELRHLINSLNRLNGYLATKDSDLAELVSNASQVFRALADERTNVSAAVHELPSTLTTADDALGRVERMARVLGPTVEKLRPAVRALKTANEQTAPFAREAAPQLHADIRPFVRELRPLLRELRPAATNLVKAEPALTRTFTVVNHFFNMLGFNANGREGPETADRDEGYLFYLGWLGHQVDNLFANADAHGPGRPVTTGGTCAVLRNSVGDNPELETLLGLTGALTDPAVCGTEAGG